LIRTKPAQKAGAQQHGQVILRIPRQDRIAEVDENALICGVIVFKGEMV